MDQQSSARWLETLKREKAAKVKWQGKYLTEEEHQRELDEEKEALQSAHSAGGRDARRTLSERDAMELRLAALDNLPAEEEEQRPVRAFRRPPTATHTHTHALLPLP